MAARSKAKPSEKLLDDIAQRVEQGVHVRRALPPDGRVHIDRQLPFLIVYRPPPGSSDPALRSLVASQASYVIAPTDRSWRSFTLELVERIARLQSSVFGGFLLVELWVQPDAGDTDTVADDIRPDFEVAIPRQLVDTPSVDALVSGLSKVRILGHKANVLVRPSVPLAPQDETSAALR